MLSKEDVLKNFSKEDSDEVVKVYEWMKLAYVKDIPVFSKFFCKPSIWMYFVEKFSNNQFLVEANGGYEECDRRILSFNNIYNSDYPYKIVKIINRSKFNNLSHKDYLGALMACGVERDKLGDLRVEDDFAIVPVYEEIVDYILTQLETVGRAPVEARVIEKDDVPKSKFKEEIIIIPSLRIDNFVSKLSNLSRVKAMDLISANKVLVDYSKVKEKSQDIKEGQRITISGVGKFIVGSIIGSTKSGRYKIIIKKYI